MPAIQHSNPNKIKHIFQKFHSTLSIQRVKDQTDPNFN